MTPAGPGYPRRRIPALCAAGARTANTTACMALARASSVLKRQWRRPSPAGPGLSLRPAVLCLRLYAQWQRSTVSECDGPGPGSAAAGGLGGSTQRTPTAAGGGPARARQPESHKFLLSLSRRAQCAVASTGALQVMPVPRSVSGSNHRVTVTVAGGAPGAASHGHGLMMPGQ